jgi:hypothetical protein
MAFLISMPFSYFRPPGSGNIIITLKYRRGERLKAENFELKEPDFFKTLHLWPSLAPMVCVDSFERGAY